MNPQETALCYLRGGLSVIPIRADATKAPLIPWKEFQDRRPEPSEIQQWFGNGNAGIGVVSGRASGNLEVVDFEAAFPIKEWAQLMELDPGGKELLRRLPLVQTPTGGWHLYYRCTDGIEGNQKLAQRSVFDQNDQVTVKVLAEIRGEGGYVIAPGSPPGCHPTGKPYLFARGDFAGIPSISAGERLLLLDAARTFDELPKPKAVIRGSSRLTDSRPGDEFNQRAPWGEILEPAGWTKVFDRGDVGYWRRPGKAYGWSATVNFGGSDLLYVFSTSTVFEAQEAYTKFAAYAVLSHGGDFTLAAAELARTGYGNQIGGKAELGADSQTRSAQNENQKPSQADILVSLVLDQGVTLFHDQLSDPFVQISVGDHYEIWPCRSHQFRQFLAHLYWGKCRKAIRSEVISSALNVLVAKAIFDGPRHELHNRVAWDRREIFYDLGNWKAIRMNQAGWQLDDSPPILFRRFSHQQSQVTPLRGGDLSDILRYVNLEDEQLGLLLQVCLVTSLIPDIPHPILVAHGPQGSAKTSFFRVIRRLIDPSAIETLSFPRNHTELVQQLAHHWVAPYDNITRIPEWASDTCCRAVTGEGFSKRQLYTDDEDIVYQFRRCIGLNGINIVAQKPDLLDRSILFRLEPIPEKSRKSEASLWKGFEEARPYILGAALDALSSAMSLKDEVRLERLPRMADFVTWGCAVAQALGFAPEDFLLAYQDNMRVRNEEVIASSPVAVAISALMESKEEWEGTATQLINELNGFAEDQSINTKAKNCPQAANSLVRRLNELQPNLLAQGLDVETGHYRGSQKLIGIRKIHENTVDIVGTVGVTENTSVTGFDIGNTSQTLSSISLRGNVSADEGANDNNDRNDISGKRKVVRL